MELHEYLRQWAEDGEEVVEVGTLRLPADIRFKATASWIYDGPPVSARITYRDGFGIFHAQNARGFAYFRRTGLVLARRS